MADRRVRQPGADRQQPRRQLRADAAMALDGAAFLVAKRPRFGEDAHRHAQHAGVVKERRHALQLLVPAAPIHLEADPERLEQALVNLIINAAKYTRPGGRIWVKATADDTEVVIQVQDNGIGIAPEKLPRLFDLFTQVENARDLAQHVADARSAPAREHHDPEARAGRRWIGGVILIGHPSG